MPLLPIEFSQRNGRVPGRARLLRLIPLHWLLGSLGRLEGEDSLVRNLLPVVGQLVRCPGLGERLVAFGRARRGDRKAREGSIGFVGPRERLIRLLLDAFRGLDGHIFRPPGGPGFGALRLLSTFRYLQELMQALDVGIALAHHFVDGQLVASLVCPAQPSIGLHQELVGHQVRRIQHDDLFEVGNRFVKTPGVHEMTAQGYA